VASRFFIRGSNTLPLFIYFSESEKDGFVSGRPHCVDSGLIVARGTRRQCDPKNSYTFSRQFRCRYPLSVSEYENQRPIQFGQGFTVSAGVRKATRSGPASLVRSHPVGTCTQYNRPIFVCRFRSISREKLFCQNRERGVPEGPVVFRYKFRVHDFKRNNWLFAVFHGGITHPSYDTPG
jgi:hypothetical protein